MNLRYPLYNLDDKEFEKLVAIICEKILGTGVIVFSKGKDGGRDAEFKGKANKFPSDKTPWEGIFIIQAKHSTKPTASCSDSHFKTILKGEFPKLAKLKNQNRINYYLLFTNRKLSGIQSPKIGDFLDEKVEVENRILGEERIQLWLEEYPEIVKTLGLKRLLMPLEFYEKDIQELVIEFSEIKISKKEMDKIESDFKKIPIEEKNRLNKLSKEYFDNALKSSYSEFQKIKSFLEDPKNDECKIKYDNTVSDLQDEILIKRDEYSAFEEILNHLYKLILDSKNDKLCKNRRLIRVFLHYMYVNCQIGIKES